MNGVPKIKLSEDKEKVLIPGRKKVFRVSDETGLTFDVMLNQDEPDLETGPISVSDPF
jgi:hypothetical protein